MIDKLIGKIKWFKEEKGYGYITGYDEETYYFELDNLLIDIEKIKPELEVKFIPNTFTSMSYADEIELAEEPNDK